MSAAKPQIIPKRVDNSIFDQIPPIEIARIQEHWETLTAKQMQIARMIGDGSGLPEIACQLHIRADRIEGYVQGILHELDIDSETTLQQVMAWVMD